jgi:predicted SAM-dependent methyltransferase
MLSQTLKDAYFAVNRYAVLPNTVRVRWRYRKPSGSGLYLHLGCGANPIEGMINVDGNVQRRAVWLDLRNRLPFPDESAKVVYCSHVLEHFFPEDAQAVLKEMRRVLRGDGVVRLATPSMEHALRVARGEAKCTFPRQYQDPLAQAVEYLFCYGQHKYGYSFSLVEEFARAAGFSQVEDCSAQYGLAPRQYDHLLLGKEPEGSLVVELRR